MLSILSSGTLQLSGELTQRREEAYKLMCDREDALLQVQKHNQRFRERMTSISRIITRREDFNLMAAAFLCLAAHHRRKQVLRRRCDLVTASRGTAWLWLWRRKIICLWRRACVLQSREVVDESHVDGIGACKQEIHQLQSKITLAENSTSTMHRLLMQEKAKSAALEADLVEARAQISGLQATLKKAYVSQFEEAQLRETVEEKFSALVGKMQKLKHEREYLLLSLEDHKRELAESQDLNERREMRLHEASGELSIAEIVIEDITSTKCSAMRRFFDKYDLPGVLLSLFRKTIELNGNLRGRDLTRQPSMSSVGSPPPCSPPSSPRLKTTASSPLACEVRKGLNIHRDGSFSRHSLQVFIESLHLSQVSAAMATQVLLGLLDLPVGEGPCELSRFVSALSAPPAWETSQLAKDLWGSLGESAASIVAQTRQQSRGRGRLDCPSTPPGVIERRLQR